MSLGMPEIIVLLVIALLIFGPTRLPGLGKSMGEAIRGFKKGIDGAGDKDVTESAGEIEEPQSSPLHAQKEKQKQEDPS